MLFLVEAKEIECLSLTEKPLFLTKNLQSFLAWSLQVQERRKERKGREREQELFLSTMHHFGLNEENLGKPR